ncbi:MAG: hypothetical protein J4F97_02605 [Pseudomonadales bacterium]|nr:hypothetical protein [Pseudomonadales bacterium]
MDFVSPVLIAGTILMFVFLLWGFYLNRSSQRESLQAEQSSAVAGDADPFNGELPDGGVVRVGPKNPLKGRQRNLDLGSKEPVARVRVPRKKVSGTLTRRKAEDRATPDMQARVPPRNDKKPETLDTGKNRASNVSPFQRTHGSGSKPPKQVRRNLVAPGNGTSRAVARAESDTLDYTWLTVFERNREATITGPDLSSLMSRMGLQRDANGAFIHCERRTNERLFYVFSALKPAEFPEGDLSEFVTNGLVILLELGGVSNPSAAFEMALRFANEAANVLPNVEVCDDRKVPLCDQRIQKYRQFVAEFSRERLSAAAM